MKQLLEAASQLARSQQQKIAAITELAPQKEIWGTGTQIRQLRTNS